MVVYHVHKKSGNFWWNENRKINCLLERKFSRQNEIYWKETKIPKRNFQMENVRSIR